MADRFTLRNGISDCCAALGLALISSVWVLTPIVSPSHMSIFHWSAAASDLFLPSLADFVIAWLLLSSLLLFARSNTRRHLVVWAAILSFLPAVALKNWALFSGSTPSHLGSRTLWIGGLAAWLLLIFLRTPGLSSPCTQTIKLSRTILTFLALPAVMSLGQATWFGWQARHLNDHPQWSKVQSAQTQAGKPKIIWIVLDELSYKQVYGDRFPGLKLPAFDALAQTATVFTNAQPAGMLTERIMPEMLTGRSDDLVRSSLQGDLFLHDPHAKLWRRFDQQGTVFEDARRAGYNTAVVGWYNPYCRFMPQVLNACFWTLDSPVGNGMLPDRSAASNMLRPLEFLLGRGIPQKLFTAAFHLPSLTKLETAGHEKDYERLSAAGDRVLLNPSLDFVLLHLPIPHTPGIYKRSRAELTSAATSYIDNLALADNYLAHVRTLLQSTGQWSSSTLVVMGDHSWRIPLWRATENWTPEDEKASHRGEFDSRPVYIVKLPGQSSGAQIAAPFPILSTRPLLDSLLSRNSVSADDLMRWVGRSSQLATLH